MHNKPTLIKRELKSLEVELQQLESQLIELPEKLKRLKELSHGTKTEADKLVQSAKEVSNGRFTMQ